MTKIQILTTAENNDVIDEIFGQTGNDLTSQALIQQAYDRLITPINGLKAEIISAGGHNEYVEAQGDNLIESINSMMTAEAHAEFTEYFNRISFHTNGDNNVVVPLSFCTEKLEGFDLFVGYAVADDELDPAHLTSHESLTDENAIAVMRMHNQWLRDNQEIFDVFIDGESLEDALEIIRNL